MTRYNTYYPDKNSVVLIPEDKDKRSQVHAPKKGNGAVPVAFEPDEKVRMHILDSYQPSQRELALVEWAKKEFQDDPHIAAEVHGIVYRSLKTFELASKAQHMKIWKKAQELRVGIPEPEFSPKV